MKPGNERTAYDSSHTFRSLQLLKHLPTVVTAVAVSTIR